MSNWAASFMAARSCTHGADSGSWSTTLAGRGELLKGYNIAVEVFDRPESFDPAIDPLVRIEAARLRDKLREYYKSEGQNDPIRIDLPKGAYTPHIEIRRPAANEGDALAQDGRARTRWDFLKTPIRTLAASIIAVLLLLQRGPPYPHPISFCRSF